MPLIILTCLDQFEGQKCCIDVKDACKKCSALDKLLKAEIAKTELDIQASAFTAFLSFKGK